MEAELVPNLCLDTCVKTYFEVTPPTLAIVLIKETPQFTKEHAPLFDLWFEDAEVKLPPTRGRRWRIIIIIIFICYGHTYTQFDLCMSPSTVVDTANTHWVAHSGAARYLSVIFLWVVLLLNGEMIRENKFHVILRKNTILYQHNCLT